MADFGSPVIDPRGTNPGGNALEMLSGVLGIKQQQQQLRSQTAAADQASQQNAELQALSKFTIGASQDPAFRNPDGSLNVQKFQQEAQKVAPVYGQAYIGQATSNANQAVDNRKALLGLTNEQRATIGNVLGSFAANPNAGPNDFLNAVEQARSISPDAGYQRMIDSALMNMPQLHGMTTEQATNTLKGVARQFAVSASSPDAALSQPTREGYTTPSGAIGSLQTNPMAPGGVQPIGPAVPQGFAPTVGQAPSGQLAKVSPQGVQVLPAGQPSIQTSGAPQTSRLQPMQKPSPNAPAGDIANYNQRITQLGDEYHAVSTAANDPTNGVQATRYRNAQILGELKNAATGPGRETLTRIASFIPGTHSADVYQDIEHYTAQNSAALAKLMGVPNTNLGAETAAAAAGNVSRTPAALREITLANDALNSAFDAYNRGMAKVTDNGSDMSRAAAYKQAFGQNLNIDAFRWANAFRTGDQKEIDALSKKYGKSGIDKLRNSLRTIQSLATTGDMPQ